MSPMFGATVTIGIDPLLQLQAVSDPLLALKNNPSSSSSSSVSLFCNRTTTTIIASCSSSSWRKKKNSTMASSNMRTNNYLRHVESMKLLPSGAGHISHLNAVILGESLASEEDDFVLPSEEFASQANVQSPEQVFSFYILLIDVASECFLGFKWVGLNCIKI